MFPRGGKDAAAGGGQMCIRDSTKRMRSGATTARKAGKEFTWGYFVAVHKQLDKLATAS